MDPARLKKIPVFADVDDEELRHIANLMAEVSVPDGKELVREGDYSYDVLVIEEGTARGGEERGDGRRPRPRRRRRRDGRARARQRNATVVATSPMRLFTLTGWDIRRLRKSAPDAVDHLRSVVAERKEHA